MVSKDYRREAREALKGKWVNMSLMYFIYSMVIGVAITVGIVAMYVVMFLQMGMKAFTQDTSEMGAQEAITLLISILPIYILIFVGMFLLMGVMHVGFYGNFINVFKNKYEQPNIGRLFKGAKYCAKAMGLYLLTGLYICLWSLLFYIPGILKALSYAMAPYIFAENPELGINECITKSKEMMKGNRWQYFCLGCSFFGWILLLCCTMIIPILGYIVYMVGIYVLYVYIIAAQSRFYLHVSGQDRLLNEPVIEADSYEYM